MLLPWHLNFNLTVDAVEEETNENDGVFYQGCPPASAPGHEPGNKQNYLADLHRGGAHQTDAAGCLLLLSALALSH